MPKLGKTTIEVMPLCLGGNVFGWTIDEHDSLKVLDAYVGEGGNFIDTADVYSAWVPTHHGGESEAIVGNWIRDRHNRSHVVIATKVGMLPGKAGRRPDLSREHIFQAVDQSLRRLHTDSIDLYFAHEDDPETPLEETLGAFADLVEAGKVCAAGASNYTAPRLAEALRVCEANDIPRYEVLQPLYNLARREGYEGELERFCIEHQMSVVPYSSLASGFLTGKYRRGAEMPRTQRAAGVREKYWNERDFALLDRLDQIATQYHATPAQIALAWLLTRPGITAPIASATTVEQIRELMGALLLKLDREALEVLDAEKQGTRGR